MIDNKNSIRNIVRIPGGFWMGGITGVFLTYSILLVFSSRDVPDNPKIVHAPKTASKETAIEKVGVPSQTTTGEDLNPISTSSQSSSITIPRSSLSGIRLRMTSPDSDDLNVGLLQSLGLDGKQVNMVQTSYYETLERIKQLETRTVSVVKNPQGKISLNFSDQDSEVRGAFERLRNALDSVIKDGRSEIIYSNMIRSNAFGYGDGSKLEIFSEMSPDPNGGEFQQVFQKRTWFNEATKSAEFSQYPIDLDYFKLRYKHLLPLISINPANGDF